eukprot:Skav231042  [mRNA]  locus=scaffold446:189922:195806:+ [translate_table: standard]
MSTVATAVRRPVLTFELAGLVSSGRARPERANRCVPRRTRYVGTSVGAMIAVCGMGLRLTRNTAKSTRKSRGGYEAANVTELNLPEGCVIGDVTEGCVEHWATPCRVRRSAEEAVSQSGDSPAERHTREREAGSSDTCLHSDAAKRRIPSRDSSSCGAAGAGVNAEFSDDDFKNAGAEILSDAAAVMNKAVPWGITCGTSKADIIFKVRPPSLQEVRGMRPDTKLFSPSIAQGTTSGSAGSPPRDL